MKNVGASGMIAPPEVAVIIASHSRPDPLREVLTSIERQRQDLPIEVVVVDNLSARSDQIRQVVEEFPQVRLIGLDQNLGFGLSINRGADATTAPLLYFGCDDVLFTDGCLKRLRDSHLARPRAGLTCPIIYRADDPRQVRFAGGMYHIGLTPGITPFSEIPASANDQDYPVTFAVGGALLVGRDLLQALGGYRDDFFMYEEDTELSLRVCRSGREIVMVPGARVLDLGPPNTFNHTLVQPGILRNQLAVILLHFPGWLVLPTLTKHLFAGIRRLWGATPQLRSNWFIAWRRFLGSIPRLMADRQRINRSLRSLRRLNVTEGVAC